MHKNILLLDELGKQNTSIYRLAMCLELENLGNTVQFSLPEPYSEIDGHHIISPEHRISVSQLKEECARERSDPDVVQRYGDWLDDIVRRREEASQATSFRIEEDADGEKYIVFPQINQDIHTIDGIYAHRMSVKDATIRTEKDWQAALLRINPDITPYIPQQISDAADNKITQQYIFEGTDPPVPTPATICLPAKEEGYSEAEIQEKLHEKGMDGPYVVKASHGWEGTQVYFPNSMENICRSTNHITQNNDGVVIQTRIPEEREGFPEFIRIVVADGEMLGAIKTTGRKNAFPEYPGAALAHSNDNLHAVQEPYEPTQAQIDAALSAGNAIDKKTGKKGVYGVDLSTTNPPIVFEINEGPSLQSHLLYDQDTVPRVAEIYDQRVTQSILQKSSTAINPQRTISFKIINSRKVLSDSDKHVFDEAQAEINDIISTDYSDYYSHDQHAELVEHLKANSRRLQILRDAQEGTEWGQLQAYFAIRRRAYEKAYGAGSYPYHHDANDLESETRTILLMDETEGQKPKVIGGFRMTFSPEGHERPLHYENNPHVMNAESLLDYLPGDPGWSEGMKYAQKASYNQQERHTMAIRSYLKKTKYAELGAFAIDPELQGQGIGSEMFTEFFKFLKENGGMDGEAFIVAEATPASIKPLFKATIDSDYPCIARMDAGAVVETQNGTPVPRTIVVLSHDESFIERMKRSVGKFRYETPESYLGKLDEAKQYVQQGCRWGDGLYRSARIEDNMERLHINPAVLSR